MKSVRRVINRVRFEHALKHLSDTKMQLLLDVAREHTWRLISRNAPGAGGPVEVWTCGSQRWEIYDRETARSWR
jgi:hypothetical protein